MSESAERTPWRMRERVFWSALAVVVTVVLVSFREQIGGAHVALAYLLVVLGASARGGRRLGMVLALLCFLAFNFFFIRPYHTFIIHRPLDWLVLATFLVTSAVATQLLHRAQEEAEAARRRADEIDRLAVLGAETLNVGRAEDAVLAIAQVVQGGLGVALCEIYLRDDPHEAVRCLARAAGGAGAGTPPESPAPRLLRRAAAGLGVAERADGSVAVARDDPQVRLLEALLSRGARSLLIPLRVRGGPVGVLRLAGPGVITLDPGQQRFAEALSYYAALALERVRLSAAAAHADALREADRLKDAVLASVSHDLRTPLTTIKALAHEIASGGDARAAVVEQEADRLNRFVSDLLDLSRLNAGAPSLAPELIAAEDVLGAALQQVAGFAGERIVRGSLDRGAPLLVGRFDFTNTLRALVNLIDNALKYSGADTEVEVSVRRDGGVLAFQVADRGTGVPEGERERIFDPFYRGSGIPDAGGTGLGLAIARRAAELQGGSLSYAPRPGGGSVFTIRLPAVAPAELEGMSL